MNPYISVIVPVYNVEKYLRQCLDSLVNQTLENIEIILIDDGSTDSSGEICEEYVKKDSRIHLIHQENRGLSAARNRGLEVAKGEYIGFLDSDDWALPRMYEILYRSCLEQKVDISCCDFWVFHNEKLTEQKHSGRIEKISNIQFMKDILHGKPGRNFVVWNKLYHRDIFEKTGIRFTEGRVYEDVDIIYKLIFNVEEIAYINQGLCVYRQGRENSITSQKYGVYEKDRLKSYKGMYTYIKENVPELYDDVLVKCLEMYVVIVGKMITLGVYDKKVYVKIQKKLRHYLPWILRKEKKWQRKIKVILCASNYHVYRGAYCAYSMMLKFKNDDFKMRK